MGGVWSEVSTREYVSVLPWHIGDIQYIQFLFIVPLFKPNQVVNGFSIHSRTQRVVCFSFYFYSLTLHTQGIRHVSSATLSVWTIFSTPTRWNHRIPNITKNMRGFLEFLQFWSCKVWGQRNRKWVVMVYSRLWKVHFITW